MYINFDSNDDPIFQHNHYVHYTYQQRKYKYDAIKSINGRKNWSFSNDLTIPLSVFDKMIGVNMDSFKYVVLLCKNYI